MKDLGIIRRMYYRDGLSLSEIERRTGITRKTIRLWLKTPEDTEPKYHRRPSDRSKIAPFSEYLTQALAMDARRPKRDRPALPASLVWCAAGQRGPAVQSAPL